MREKRSYLLFRKHLKQGSDRIERIENSAGAGTPDVNFCIEGVNGWIELKAPIEPKRKTSRLFPNKVHQLSLSQRNWFLQQKNAGGKAFIFVTTNHRAMLFDSRIFDRINMMSVQELIDESLWHCETPVGKIEWSNLRMKLTQPLIDFSTFHDPNHPCHKDKYGG